MTELCEAFSRIGFYDFVTVIPIKKERSTFFRNVMEPMFDSNYRLVALETEMRKNHLLYKHEHLTFAMSPSRQLRAPEIEHIGKKKKIIHQDEHIRIVT